jgi:hypothetical protein
VVVKIRYTKTSMTSRSLHRVLTSDRVAKYATIGKFLGVAPVVLVTGQPSVQSPAQPQPPTLASTMPTSTQPTTVNPILELDPNLDLLDGLVAETLTNKSLTSPATPTSQAIAAPQAAVSTRAKEVVSASSQDLLAPKEQLVEATADSQEASGEASTEVIPTVESQEVQELTKELQEVSKETKEQREQAMIQEKQRAINDLAAASTTPVAITDKPVVVLPITAKSREEAKFKSTKYSVKWLWEWSQKIIKMFAGAVVYKEEVDEA